jgi:phage terminase small subunit
MLTKQKRLYADARLSGLGKKASAIAAGCPEKTACQAASRYEKDPDIQAAMGRSVIVQAAKEKKVDEPTVDLDAYIPTAEEDPLKFLAAIMLDPEAEPRLRFDAAKALASFTVSKPGEKGKKEDKAEAAKVASKGRFAAAPAPGQLRAVK